ncbi:DNA-binding transcriptional MerR regulator [Thermocatellispora tengchongensis]|uniref:DNA-binding transcriptional MerR regulator n=1 Tax=Thermocatellispora tengchongensis TaxID=1073253 RepID=A0A840P4A7_9ACTN|nr:MerR family transcriptional regulator [Thermocatellispora tengchongensis]MBB5133829.1 DNA-binding transcriptional MerR regulator [Thermocatellispora tengchongensis]
MRIGELSARTGASRRSLRYYEQQGLLVSRRSPSGQRYYDDDHVERVALIQKFLAAGMSSRSIAEIVPCMAEPSRAKALRALITMDQERARLSSAINSLTAAREALDHLIDDNLEYVATTADDPTPAQRN